MKSRVSSGRGPPPPLLLLTRVSIFSLAANPPFPWREIKVDCFRVWLIPDGIWLSMDLRWTTPSISFGWRIPLNRFRWRVASCSYRWIVWARGLRWTVPSSSWRCWMFSVKGLRWMVPSSSGGAWMVSVVGFRLTFPCSSCSSCSSCFCTGITVDTTLSAIASASFSYLSPGAPTTNLACGVAGIYSLIEIWPKL